MNSYKILTDFEVAQSLSAIEAVARLGKPLAEVCVRKLSSGALDDLEEDLRTCLAVAGERGIKGFIRQEDEAGWTYGFFRYPWVLEALELLASDCSDIEPHRHWIAGLLFGYRADAIDQFITSPRPGSTWHPSCSERMAGTHRPSTGRCDSRSSSTARCRIVDTCDPSYRS